MNNNPQKFSDVLGALVTSVAHGRKVADVGALHIAKSYYKNELLKGLPIPRLRIEKVSISLPLILSDVIPGTPAEPNKPHEIAQQVCNTLINAISKEKTRLDILKQLLDEKNITDEQKKAILDYEDFLEIWDDKWDSSGSNDGLAVFRDKLSNQIEISFKELKTTEGNIEPSDISIIDTVIEATNKVFDEITDQAYVYVQEKQKKRMANGEKENKRIEDEKDRIEFRRAILSNIIENDSFSADIGEKLQKMLSDFEEELEYSITAESIDRFEKKWEDYIAQIKSEVQKEGKEVPSAFENLSGRHIIFSSDGNCDEISQKIEKFDDVWAIDALKGLIDNDYNYRFISSLSEAAENAAVKTPTIPPDLSVVVNTEEIKNSGGGPEVITRLNFILHEEGLEWATDKGRTTLMAE